MNVDRLEKVIARMRELAVPEPDHEFRCAACKDTGLIDVERDGKRYASRCTSIAHQRLRPVEEPSVERFS